MATKQFDFRFKLITLGDSSVGKTSLINMYVYNKMNINTCTGGAFYSKTLILDSTNINLELWDTCGIERYRELSPMYYRQSNGVMLVYDITNRQSFDNLRDIWYRDARLYRDMQTQYVLIGNKCDLESERAVEYSTGKELADSLNIPFIETSAKESINVQQVLVLITAVIVKNITETGSEKKYSIQLSGETGGSNSTRCYC